MSKWSWRWAIQFTCSGYYAASLGQKAQNENLFKELVWLISVTPPATFPPPLSPVPLYLHEHGSHPGFFGAIWPRQQLHTKYIGMYYLFVPPPDKSRAMSLSETSRHWRYGRDSKKGLGIGMEWIYRLFVSSFEVMRLSEGQPLAFYLTAHFDQEDIPYDWQVRFITFACAYSCPNLYRLMHWLSKVRSAWSQYRRCHLLAFALRINSNLDGFAVESLKSRRVQSVGVS